VYGPSNGNQSIRQRLKVAEEAALAVIDQVERETCESYEILNVSSDEDIKIMKQLEQDVNDELADCCHEPIRTDLTRVST
jgi:hypothetical protein